MNYEDDIRKFPPEAKHQLLKLARAFDESEIPPDADADGVTIVWSSKYNKLFLKSRYNEDFIGVRGERLEKFYKCESCDAEGFFNEIQHKFNDEESKKECDDWIKETQEERRIK